MGWFKDFFYGVDESEEQFVTQQAQKFSGAGPKIEHTNIAVGDYIANTFTNRGNVGREEALSLPAIVRGRNLVCNIADYPLETYEPDNKMIGNEFLAQIDPYGLSNQITWSNILEDMIFDGVGYLIVDQRDPNGYPLKAHWVQSGAVEVDAPNNAAPTWLSSGVHPQGSYWVNGKRVPAYDVIRFDSPNHPLLKVLRRIISRAIATAKASEMFANNPTPVIVFTTKAEVAGLLDKEDLRNEVQRFANTARRSPFNAIDAPLDMHTLTMSPRELELAQAEQNIERGLANAMGLDPEDLGISTTSRTYNNDTSRQQDRINTLLVRFMRAIEQRLSQPDVTPEGFFVKFNLDDYLRADPKTRAEVHAIYIDRKVMPASEVRKIEGRAPLTPEQKQEIAAQAPQPAITEAGEKFSAGEDITVEFSSSTFIPSALDPEKRTVTGLAIPWGKIGHNPNGSYMFERGSVEWSDLSRVKFLRDHDKTQPIGRAIDIQDTDQGLMVTFKVASGAEGDRVFADITDMTRDGLSVGLARGADTYKDPAYPGVLIFRKAQLLEVTQTALPAFDDSRITDVKLARYGENMSDTTPVANEATTPEMQFTAADFEKFNAMQGLLSSMNTNKAQKPATAQAAAQAPAELPKDNNQYVQVKEESPYRFDGTGEFEFSGDVIKALKGEGDTNTHKRLDAWVAETFAVATTNVVEANPTKNRPELYVDERSYKYPIWNTLYKGVPDNGVQPFTVPKYNSDSGLVADHVEGTEPALGAFDMTSQTVTPSAVSGKIEINREAWDMGGNPSTSLLIRNLMTKRYFEALERYAATYLDNLTLTGLETTLTTAGTDAQIVDQFEGAIADLTVARGAESLSELLLHITLHKKLLLAKDSTGRRLIPRIGATNANGTAGSRLASLDLDGFIGRPAWGFSNGVSTDDGLSHSSYLLDPNAVWAWATQPEFKVFDIQLKSVYLGLWGYKAIAALDINGIRRIKYDTTT